MPWPDFSELSFGFSFLREFERLHAPGGAFPSAPDFISQADEASLGYDVEAALAGSNPVFFQFKRSFVLTTHKANEIQNGNFPHPVLYRMHLRKKENYRQHKALRKLERRGNTVLYVTSQIRNFTDLTRAYVAGNVVNRTAALFAPLEINLPDDTGDHHLCFRASDNYAYVYSEEGQRFTRKHPNWELTLERSLIPGRRTAPQNRELLQQIVRDLERESPVAKEISDRFQHPAIKASILSFLVLDAQLSLFRK
jgi:hypothetical protein